MSGLKYYNDGVTYSSPANVGQIYYDITHGSASQYPLTINWMSNINLSRRNRSKNMYVNPTYNIDTSSLQISISQNKSNLLLLPCCINYEQSDDQPFDMIEGSSMKESGLTYWVQDNQLGSWIDVVVLTNGNVINASIVPSESDTIISSIDDKVIYYYNILETDIPMYYANNNPLAPDDQKYQRYPYTLINPCHAYIGAPAPGSNYGISSETRFTPSTSGHCFDSITYDSNNTVETISITNGGVLLNENYDYGKENNLVAVKIKVLLTGDLEDATNAGRIKIVSAVYNPDVREGAPVELDYTTCKVMIIEFRLNTANYSINGDSSISFDEAGVVNGEHSVETSITTNVPFTIGETNTGSQE